MRASPKRGKSDKRDLGEDLLDNRIERGCVLGYHALRPWPTLFPPPCTRWTGWAGEGGGGLQELVRLGCVDGSQKNSKKNGVLGEVVRFGWPYPVPCNQATGDFFAPPRTTDT